MKDGWHFLVLTPKAIDPQETAYQLVKIKKDEIVERDGQIIGCDRGWRKRVKEAFGRDLLIEKQTTTIEVFK